MAQDKGIGPLPPLKPKQPIRGMESGAPVKLGGGLPPLGKLSPLGGGGMGPLKSMAPLAPLAPIDQDEIAMDRMRALPIDPVDTPSAPFENPPIDTPKSFKGWLKNFGDDVTHFVEGIPAMLEMAWREGKWLSKNLDGLKLLAEKPEFLMKSLDQLKTDVIKGMTDHYKDGFGEALYKHPFSVLLDATTIFDVVGGGLKLAGKTALSAAERAALKAGKAIDGTSMGARLIKLGHNVQKAPGRFVAKPFELAGRGALKIPAVQRAAMGFALTPYGLQKSKRLASFILNERAIAFKKREDFWRKSISKEDWAEYWHLAIGKKPMSKASKPYLRDHAKSWQEYNRTNEEWMKSLGIKSQIELEQAALKPLVEELFAEGKIIEPWTISQDGHRVYKQEALDAARKYKEGANEWGEATETLYNPYFMEKDADLFTVIENLENSGKSLHDVHRFNPKGGREGINMNPLEIQARATVQIAELRGITRFITETILENGVVVKSLDEIPEGYKLMDPILLRYVEKGLIPAHEAMVSKVAQDLMKGQISPAEAVKKAAREVNREMGEQLYKAAKEAADERGNWTLAIPIEDARLIESQLRGVSGPLRFYDKILNTWRSVVLRMMPRYYVNNLLGNSILLMAGGHLPWMKTVADHKVYPAEAIGSTGLLAEQGFDADLISSLPGMRKFNRLTDELSDFTDAKPRGLLLETKLREIIKSESEIGNEAAQALLALGSMDEAVKAALAIRKEMMELSEQQAILAKKVSLQTIELKKLDQIDYQINRLKVQMDEEAALSNAMPKQTSAAVQQIERQLQDAIGRNAQVTEIRILQQKLKKAQKAQQNVGPSSDRYLDLQAQLEHAQRGREQMLGNYPYERTPMDPGNPWGTGINKDQHDLLMVAGRRQALEGVSRLTEKAVSEMERFLGAYGRLHPLERNVIRRIIPFWTFVKTMNQLLFTLPFTSPKRAFLWHHYAKLMIDGANDDRLPYRFRNHIPIGGGMSPNGESFVIFMKASGWNPFEAVEMTQLGGIRIPKLVDPANNPFVKVIIEARGGYDTFTEKPFTTPEDMVTIDGTVWRYDPMTNTLQPRLPQKPLIASLLGQIPHVRVIQEMIDSFPGTRPALDAMGAPVTRKDPEGNYFYDRSPLWAASRAMGFPIHVSNPEKVKQQHQMLVKGMIKRFTSASRRVDPETREKLMHILTDLANGGFELREW